MSVRAARLAVAASVLAAVVSVAVVLVASHQAERAEQSVEEAVSLIRRRTMYTASWTSGGATHGVQTRLQEFDANETKDQWLARHVAAVNALKAAFPPG